MNYDRDKYIEGFGCDNQYRDTVFTEFEEDGDLYSPSVTPAPPFVNYDAKPIGNFSPVTGTRSSSKSIDTVIADKYSARPQARYMPKTEQYNMVMNRDASATLRRDARSVFSNSTTDSTGLRARGWRDEILPELSDNVWDIAIECSDFAQGIITNLRVGVIDRRKLTRLNFYVYKTQDDWLKQMIKKYMVYADKTVVRRMAEEHAKQKEIWLTQMAKGRFTHLIIIGNTYCKL
nr:hypothetical protein [Diaporthe pseudophoenicicola chrysovirus 1]